MTLSEKTQEFKRTIHLQNAAEGLALFGPQDDFLDLLETFNEATIHTRSETITVSGNSVADVDSLTEVLEVLLYLIRQGHVLTMRDVHYTLNLAKEGKTRDILSLLTDEIATTYRGKVIRAKTLGQRHYVQVIKRNTIVFGVGPAGTGKTYLAVVFAVNAWKQGEVKKILLTRPAVEAGENLGFLPGDLQEKVDPYLRPLYDALNDVLGPEQLGKLMERGVIEIAPLAYMRGRTLNDAFIILDEAQNTTTEQMKMFLTRLGYGSKMVITGDITQIDLPRGKTSGLVEARRVLRGIEGIAFIHFSEHDVVRHYLVQQIIQAYARQDERDAHHDKGMTDDGD